MMTIADKARYQGYRLDRSQQPWIQTGLYEYLLPMLLFGSMGAITWAIRGTGGWGGIDGTILPGMTWGLLWYYLCYRKGIDARAIPLWLGLGIALGGELGYGQYVSWIQGKFYAGDQILAIPPRLGYTWFVLCGIGWGAPGGIALGWALRARTSLGRWLIRIAVPFGVAYLGWLLVQHCPSWFFPNYHLGLYAGALDRHLERTVYTNTQNFTVVAWWLGAMLVAAFQRDRATLVAGGLIGGGFGVGFMLSALWCLGYAYAPAYIDWWKLWELNAGFNLGLLYVIVLSWATRQVDRAHHPDGGAIAPSPLRQAPPNVVARRRSIALTLSVFLLLLVVFHGATYQAGVMLELYDAKAVDQYAWPWQRVVLFAPWAVLIVGVTAFSLGRTLWRSRTPDWTGFDVPRLPERMIDLMTLLAAVGAITIWPAKIGALYACFLILAVFALTRLNRHCNRYDGPQSPL